MKTRNGFVSNSSSSSFVVIGIEIDAEEFGGDVGPIEKLNLYYDYIESTGCFIVGKRLARWSDGEGDVESTSLGELQKIAGELNPILVKLNLKEPKEIKLYYGENYG